MITQDMPEAILLADRIAVMRSGKLLAQGTPAGLAASGDAYVGELLRTPRRQAERLNEALPRGGALTCYPTRAGARRWPICPTISATMCASASRRSPSGLR